MASRWLLVVVAVELVVLRSAAGGGGGQRRDGLMDTLHNGMKLAQGLLGSESVALKVADFVVRAFQTANNKHGNNNVNTPNDHRPPSAQTGNRPYDNEDQDGAENGGGGGYGEEGDPAAGVGLSGLRQVVRLLGLRPAQLGAVAVNALLLVAQVIATFLASPKPALFPSQGRPSRAEDPLAWLLAKDSRPLQDLLATARNESLSDAIQDLVKEQGPEEETSCLRLLACKVAPFVAKMQNAVFGGTGGGGGPRVGGGVKGALYRDLPSREEVLKTSDSCEIKHQDCDLNVL